MDFLTKVINENSQQIVVVHRQLKRAENASAENPLDIFIKIVTPNLNLWTGHITNETVNRITDSRLKLFILACPEKIIECLCPGSVKLLVDRLDIRIDYIDRTLTVPLVRFKESPACGDNRVFKSMLMSRPECPVFPQKYTVLTQQNLVSMCIANETLMDFAYETHMDYKDHYDKLVDDNPRDEIFDSWFSAELLMWLRIHYLAHLHSWELMYIECTNSVFGNMLFKKFSDKIDQAYLRNHELKKYIEEDRISEIVQLEQDFLIVKLRSLDARRRRRSPS